jgi:hypothetical protein
MTAKKTRCLAVAALALALSQPAQSIEVDGVAAKVGSETILKSDVYAEMGRLGVAAEEYAAVRNEMIERKLILKAARESKLVMQEWVVENRVREIVAKTFGGDRNKLMETLSQRKIPYGEWYQRMKEDMLVAAMRWNVVDKFITASPEAMRREYSENASRYREEGSVSVSVIMLKPDEKAKREEISAAVKSKTFEELGAKSYVDIKPEDLFKSEICREIAEMPKGTISHWLEIDGWSFLLRKNDEKKGRAKSFAEAYDEIEANVRSQLSARQYAAWIDRLKEETYVKAY